MKTDTLKKKIGEPIFKKGDNVITTITGKEVLTIADGTFHNGFVWMYYFEENEMGCGQNYITKVAPVKTDTLTENKIDPIIEAAKDYSSSESISNEWIAYYGFIAGAEFMKSINDSLLNALKDILSYEKEADTTNWAVVNNAEEAIQKAEQ